MDPAMDRARNGKHARTTALLLLMLGAGWTQTGCIGGGAGRDGVLAAAPHWPRARAEPSYDHYAQNMAKPRDPAAPERALAANDEPAPGRSADAETGVETRSEESPGAIVAANPVSRGRADEEVRVTLGRPESLEVVRDGAAAPGALLASAATPRPAVEPAPALAPPRERRPEAVAPPAELPEPAAVAAAAPPPVADRAEPAVEKADDDPDATLRRLLADATKRLEAMPTYQVDIARVERVGSRVQPEEEALLSIRRDPKAVRLEWPDGPNKGREVIYSAAVDERMMHVNSANSAIPIPRMSLPVDSPLALRNSRHAITEAGFDTIFENMNNQLEGPDHTPPAGGRLTYKGLQKPEGVDQTCHLIQRITPSKEIWRVYLDTESLMPVVVTAHQANGELLERYAYSNLRVNPESLAAADAFDPDKRWGEAKGFLSRLATAAGAAAEAPSPKPDESATR